MLNSTQLFTETQSQTEFVATKSVMCADREGEAQHCRVEGSNDIGPWPMNEKRQCDANI